MSRRVICRECNEGKHGACNGEAIVEWDDESLTLGPCECREVMHLAGGESSTIPFDPPLTEAESAAFIAGMQAQGRMLPPDTGEL